jgi:hypothetical protein
MNVNSSEKAAVIRGGGIPNRTKNPLFHDIEKLMIILPEKFVKTSVLNK